MSEQQNLTMEHSTSKRETKFWIDVNGTVKSCPVILEYFGSRIKVFFRYNKFLLAEIKNMDGARWHPEEKHWSIKNSGRNRFQILFLEGHDPYVNYDKDLIEIGEIKRYNVAKGSEITLYDHQVDMVAHALTRHYCEFACEMGTGKTLAAIEVMERSGHDDWYYVAPLSALKAVALEFEVWGAKVKPKKMLTYEGLRTLMKNWPEGQKAPKGVIYDEASRAKTPTAQRSQAAFALAEGIREDWGDDGYVILMSGSPAPKAPTDWWMQCEIACPGYLKEGNFEKFKRRLGLIVQKNNIITGGVYPHLVTWKDDSNKCDKCGKLKDDPIHLGTNVFDITPDSLNTSHEFVPSTNEVAYLYERMKGLVLVKLKKDCLSLPEKIYRPLKLEPSEDTLRAAQLITANSRTTIQALTLLRELSDGFQYQDIEDGTDVCPRCKGEKESVEWIDTENDDAAIIDPQFYSPEEWAQLIEEGRFKEAKITCPNCDGDGEIIKYSRNTVMVPCPKEDALIEYFEDCEDTGRAVVFAGFTGSIDRCVSVANKLNWEVIRVDGRGWQLSDKLKGSDPLRQFQYGELDRVAFIGHPESGGMGLTLTKSSSIFFYSNDFKAENRIQAEDRIHRPGMDLNRGATIIDCIHLPTDQMILDNLQKKRDLQAMTLGEFNKTVKL